MQLITKRQDFRHRFTQMNTDLREDICAICVNQWLKRFDLALASVLKHRWLKVVALQKFVKLGAVTSSHLCGLCGVARR